ncbi:MAG TPA: hypothetical protein PLG90_07485 [Ignavibacteria bacterium]|nr:hypothetical protein [Ignavibacteria bacterium]
MKKLLSLIFITTIYINTINAQIKDRSNSFSYAGIGYSLVIFTDSKVSDMYPVLNFNNTNFLSEINPFFGIRFNDNLAVEISPSFIFTNSRNNKGFAFESQGSTNTTYYLPSECNLFALPINVNAKFYPFTSDLISPVSNLYFGVGGGPMYIKERYLNYQYANSNFSGFITTSTDENSFWVPHFMGSVGYGSFAKFGYNFELSYRVVPLNQEGKKPVISSVAGNFNSLNLTARITFNF